MPKWKLLQTQEKTRLILGDVVGFLVYGHPGVGKIVEYEAPGNLVFYRVRPFGDASAYAPDIDSADGQTFWLDSSEILTVYQGDKNEQMRDL